MPGPDLGLDGRDFLAATGDSCRLLSDLMRLDFDRLRHCIESNLVEATTRAVKVEAFIPCSAAEFQ